MSLTTYWFIVIFEEKLIFFPERYPLGEWEPDIPEGYSLEDVFIDSGGIKLHSWLIEPPEKKFKSVVLLCHGNAGNITSRLAKALSIASCGVPVLLFDYRGYGKSEAGGISEQAIYQDSQAAYDYLLQNGFLEQEVLIHGISLGGGAACYLSERNKPKALSLESTFTSIPDMCKLVYPLLPRFFVSTQFNNLQRVSELKIPIQIFHGTIDELIPFSMGESLYEVANEPKGFIRVEGAGHSDLLEVAGGLFQETFHSFLVTNFSDSI